MGNRRDTDLVVEETVEIACLPEVTRRQFGDVAHHQETGVHDGVEFTVLDETDGVCRYAQISRVGPMRLRQEFELHRTPSEPLVNRIVAGQFTGGSITFDVTASDTGSRVVARLEAPLPLLARPVAPLLRRAVGRQLAAALQEDKADLESGSYPGH